jgi:hypothetical protein
MDIDTGIGKITKLIEQYGRLNLHDANEAETRRKVIDEIITKVLGWQPDDIKYEERVSEDKSTEFADYVIQTATTKLVVEAKKAGKAFEIPQNRKSGVLSGFLSVGEIGETIRQARDYARKLSVPFAASGEYLLGGACSLVRVGRANCKE